jgi:RNA polymerase sigma-70 factor (ECF subfamily)
VNIQGKNGLNNEEEGKTGANDADLLERYAAGDEDAFAQIIARYKDGLYAFLRRFLNQQDLLEDVFQETFLQLFSSRDSFDTSRALRPWLFTIAINKARDALRKQQRTAATSLGTLSEPAEMSISDAVNTLTSYETTPYDEIEKSETAERVRQVIATLPENLREILVLGYFEQFSYKQMAEMLGIPIGTVKSRLHTAVVQFTKKWQAANRSRLDETTN